MSTRYLTNVALICLGGFLLVASQAFGVPTFMWLMFGAGIATLALAGSAIATPGRGTVQPALNGVSSALGAWTIVASQVFAGATVTWLGFASGGALVVLALIGLTVHELSTERVVHSFEVRSAELGELEQEPGPIGEPAFG